MRKILINNNIPYENTLRRVLEVPKNQLEQLKCNKAIQKHDLIWISEAQDPYEQNNYYDVDSQKWRIPSTLALVTDVYYDNNYSICTLLVNDKLLFSESGYSALYTIGVHISDVVENHTEYLRKTKAAVIIQKHYKRHYFTRTLMAKRIQQFYIKHYWNPKNPNMIQRLQNEYKSLCKQMDSSIFHKVPM